MSSEVLSVYWDSNCFIAVLASEIERIDTCLAIILRAERGEIEMITSYLALVETVKVPGADDMEAEEQIRQFFDNPFIRKVELEGRIAQEARRLQRVTNLKANDAVHLATALFVGADVLHTYDTDLLRLDCDALGLPIRIEEPR